MAWDEECQLKVANAALLAARAFDRLVTLVEKLVEREFKKKEMR